MLLQKQRSGSRRTFYVLPGYDNDVEMMHVRTLFYKCINAVCHADITRVLILDTKSMAAVDNHVAVRCHWMDEAELSTHSKDRESWVTAEFIEDFHTLGFRGVAATIDGQLAGMLFLVSGSVAGRHNSGGKHFNGIGLSLPEGVSYLFKVAVRSEYRGQRINASMLAFATEQLTPQGLDAIVTTTDWTNASYLKSVEALGFQRCGYASEFVIFGRHFYQLPTVSIHTPRNNSSDAGNKSAICFLRESPSRQ